MFGTLPAPENFGARRPEKRVTARSKLPQKKCTGLHLPMNDVRNRSSTRADCSRMRQKRLREIPVVGRVNLILAEADRVGNLVGKLVDADVDAKFRKRAHDVRIEIGHAPRVEPDRLFAAVAGRAAQHVVEKVEVELEAAIAIRNCRRGQAARRYIENDVPGMVEPRGLHEPYFADDLRPELQRGAGILPGFIWQFRPGFRSWTASHPPRCRAPPTIAQDVGRKLEALPGRMARGILARH